MTLDEYDQALDEAFAFLMADFQFLSKPAERGGGRFGSGLQKTFRRGGLTVSLLIGDADSSVFCEVFFSDGATEHVEFQRRHFRYRTLDFLLQRKGIEIDLANHLRPASDTETREALLACARTLREHAIDVLTGDFSAFPQLVYVVRHVDREYPNEEARRLIGVYSSYTEAMNAIDQRRRQPGFVVRQDGFEVDCFELDRGLWATGIPIRPSGEATNFFKRVLNATSIAEFDPDEQLEIEAEWLAKFSVFQDQFEVSVAATYPADHPEREAALARYPRDHDAWSLVVDQAELIRRRSEFVNDLRLRPVAVECWRKARESGHLSLRFVVFIDAGWGRDIASS